MSKPHLPQPQTPHDKFMGGLRAVFGTTKEESDRQLAAAAEERKKRKAGVIKK